MDTVQRPVMLNVLCDKKSVQNRVIYQNEVLAPKSVKIAPNKVSPDKVADTNITAASNAVQAMRQMVTSSRHLVPLDTMDPTKVGGSNPQKLRSATDKVGVPNEVINRDGPTGTHRDVDGNEKSHNTLAHLQIKKEPIEDNPTGQGNPTGQKLAIEYPPVKQVTIDRTSATCRQSLFDEQYSSNIQSSKSQPSTDSLVTKTKQHCTVNQERTTGRLSSPGRWGHRQPLADIPVTTSRIRPVETLTATTSLTTSKTMQKSLHKNTNIYKKFTLVKTESVVVKSESDAFTPSSLAISSVTTQSESFKGTGLCAPAASLKDVSDILEPSSSTSLSTQSEPPKSTSFGVLTALAKDEFAELAPASSKSDTSVSTHSEHVAPTSGEGQPVVVKKEVDILEQFSSVSGPLVNANSGLFEDKCDSRKQIVVVKKKVDEIHAPTRSSSNQIWGTEIEPPKRMSVTDINIETKSIQHEFPQTSFSATARTILTVKSEPIDALSGNGAISLVSEGISTRNRSSGLKKTLTVAGKEPLKVRQEVDALAQVVPNSTTSFQSEHCKVGTSAESGNLNKPHFLKEATSSPTVAVQNESGKNSSDTSKETVEAVSETPEDAPTTSSLVPMVATTHPLVRKSCCTKDTKKALSVENMDTGGGKLSVLTVSNSGLKGEIAGIPNRKRMDVKTGKAALDKLGDNRMIICSVEKHVMDIEKLTLVGEEMKGNESDSTTENNNANLTGTKELLIEKLATECSKCEESGIASTVQKVESQVSTGLVSTATDDQDVDKTIPQSCINTSVGVPNSDIDGQMEKSNVTCVDWVGVSVEQDSRCDNKIKTTAPSIMNHETQDALKHTTNSTCGKAVNESNRQSLLEKKAIHGPLYKSSENTSVQTCTLSSISPTRVLNKRQSVLRQSSLDSDKSDVSVEKDGDVPSQSRNLTTLKDVLAQASEITFNTDKAQGGNQENIVQIRRMKIDEVHLEKETRMATDRDVQAYNKPVKEGVSAHKNKFSTKEGKKGSSHVAQGSGVIVGAMPPFKKPTAEHSCNFAQMSEKRSDDHLNHSTPFELQKSATSIGKSLEIRKMVPKEKSGELFVCINKLSQPDIEKLQLKKKLSNTPQTNTKMFTFSKSFKSDVLRTTEKTDVSTNKARLKEAHSGMKEKLKLVNSNQLRTASNTGITSKESPKTVLTGMRPKQESVCTKYLRAPTVNDITTKKTSKTTHTSIRGKLKGDQRSTVNFPIKQCYVKLERIKDKELAGTAQIRNAQETEEVDQTENAQSAKGMKKSKGLYFENDSSTDTDVYYETENVQTADNGDDTTAVNHPNRHGTNIKASSYRQKRGNYLNGKESTAELRNAQVADSRLGGSIVHDSGLQDDVNSLQTSEDQPQSSSHKNRKHKCHRSSSTCSMAKCAEPFQDPCTIDQVFIAFKNDCTTVHFEDPREDGPERYSVVFDSRADETVVTITRKRHIGGEYDEDFERPAKQKKKHHHKHKHRKKHKNKKRRRIIEKHRSSDRGFDSEDREEIQRSLGKKDSVIGSSGKKDADKNLGQEVPTIQRKNSPDSPEETEIGETVGSDVKVVPVYSGVILEHEAVHSCPVHGLDTISAQKLDSGNIEEESKSSTVQSTMSYLQVEVGLQPKKPRHHSSIEAGKEQFEDELHQNNLDTENIQEVFGFGAVQRSASSSKPYSEVQRKKSRRKLNSQSGGKTPRDGTTGNRNQALQLETSEENNLDREIIREKNVLLSKGQSGSVERSGKRGQGAPVLEGYQKDVENEKELEIIVEKNVSPSSKVCSRESGVDAQNFSNVAAQPGIRGTHTGNIHRGTRCYSIEELNVQKRRSSPRGNMQQGRLNGGALQSGRSGHFAVYTQRRGRNVLSVQGHSNAGTLQLRPVGENGQHPPNVSSGQHGMIAHNSSNNTVLRSYPAGKERGNAHFGITHIDGVSQPNQFSRSTNSASNDNSSDFVEVLETNGGSISSGTRRGKFPLVNQLYGSNRMPMYPVWSRGRRGIGRMGGGGVYRTNWGVS